MKILKKNTDEISGKIEYDWVKNYVCAKTILNWSDQDFWEATPKMFYACFCTYTEMHVEANKKIETPEPLVGRDAIKALSYVAQRIR